MAHTVRLRQRGAHGPGCFGSYRVDLNRDAVRRRLVAGQHPVDRPRPCRAVRQLVHRHLDGYLLAGKDGRVYNFNTPFYGSEAGKKLPAPVIGIAAAG